MADYDIENGRYEGKLAYCCVPSSCTLVTINANNAPLRRR